MGNLWATLAVELEIFCRILGSSIRMQKEVGLSYISGHWQRFNYTIYYRRPRIYSVESAVGVDYVD